MSKNYKIFNEFKTNSPGIWFFVPDTGKFKRGVACKGFGAIKYPEGSVYTGELYYDGSEFNKIGYGQQDFSMSDIKNIEGLDHIWRYKYIGKYDYRKTDWIYGNGTLYYTDTDGNPLFYKSGFFSGINKLGEWRGKVANYPVLFDFRKCEERNFDETAMYRHAVIANATERATEVGEATVLFIGDSYFGWSDAQEHAGDHTFVKSFPTTYINCGVNGSTFVDWLASISDLSAMPCPKIIVVNLGFNDIHSGKSVRKMCSDLKNFLLSIRRLFPQTEIYLLEVTHAPAFLAYRGKEDEWNSLLARLSGKLKINIISCNGLIQASDKDCFGPDRIHLNENGYAIFFTTINEELKTAMCC